jgi:hypothetical protein
MITQAEVKCLLENLNVIEPILKGNPLLPVPDGFNVLKGAVNSTSLT